jgi:phage terminase large subunit
MASSSTERSLSISVPAWARPLLAPSRYKGAWGGRSGGKSWVFVDLVLARSLADPNFSVCCMREVQRTLRESVHRLLVARIATLGIGDYFDITDAAITSKRGNGRIMFAGLQSHTAESIKSLEGYDCAWVEEAQTLSQKSLDLLRPTIRKPGSELWFSWNPIHATDPIDMLLRGPVPPNNSIVVKVNYSDNPWFSDEMKEEMEYDRSRDVDKYNHVWCGGYQTTTESRVFKNWSVQEFETPPDAVHRLGFDFGFSEAPTVGIRCHIVGRKLYIDHEAWGERCEIDDTASLFLSIPEAEKWPSVADGARPETISYLQKHGFRKMQKAVKGNDSVREGIEFLKSYEIIVHPRCVHTIAELTEYAYETNKRTGLLELASRGNDLVDALRYACEGARRIAVVKPVVVSAAPSSTSFWGR